MYFWPSPSLEEKLRFILSRRRVAAFNDSVWCINIDRGSHLRTAVRAAVSISPHRPERLWMKKKRRFEEGKKCGEVHHKKTSLLFVFWNNVLQRRFSMCAAFTRGSTTAVSHLLQANGYCNCRESLLVCRLWFRQWRLRKDVRKKSHNEGRRRQSRQSDVKEQPPAFSTL